MAQSGNEARDATLQDFGRQPRISSNTLTVGAQSRQLAHSFRITGQLRICPSALMPDLSGESPVQ
jgi:hypothetical protein